jgi:hypothetical protein
MRESQFFVLDIGAMVFCVREAAAMFVWFESFLLLSSFLIVSLSLRPRAVRSVSVRDYR